MEVVTLLDLVEIVAKKMEHLINGIITIYNDNKKICRKIHKEINVPNQLTQDAAAQVVRIREIIQKAMIKISIEWTKGYLKVYLPFQIDPASHLI